MRQEWEADNKDKISAAEAALAKTQKLDSELSREIERKKKVKRKISAIILTLFLGAVFLSGCTSNSEISVSDSEKSCCNEKSDCCQSNEISHIPDCCGE